MRQIIQDIAFVVAGIAALQQRPWARKLGVTVLAVAAYEGGFEFAYGWARGMPPRKVLVISFVVVGAWNALWIWLLCRRSP